MAIGSGGYVRVPSPGTPVLATTNLQFPTKHLSVHGVMFEALPTNTGAVYIGLQGMVAATGVQVCAIIAVPTENFLPTFSVALTISPNGLALEHFYVDADNAEDGVLVTYLQA